jgi:type I restriction enzyme M protein
VLDKEEAAARKAIFMIDASKGFMKDGNKNRLRAQDIHKIVDTFTRQVEIPRYSRVVPLAEITDPKNDFNLNLPRYIDSSEPEDLQDIDGHLRGGIPERDIEALESYWQIIPTLRRQLFSSFPSPRLRGEGQGEGQPARYVQLSVPIAELKQTILNHPEFNAFKDSITALFAKWWKAS